VKRFPFQLNRRTLLSNLFFMWVIFYFGLGGWDNAKMLLLHYGVFPWVILAIVCLLVILGSNYRIDLPIFLAALILGYWGEWWGTSRGFWTYWNNASPPIYLPPLWGIGVITVYHFNKLIYPWLEQHLPERVWKAGYSLFLVLPGLGFANSWNLLAGVDWLNRLDGHFAAGCLAGIILVITKANWKKTLLLYLCGTLIGGAYEYLGTSWGEWVYFTGEIPPLWIAPLWGYAVVAMTKLPCFIFSNFRPR